MKLIYLINQRLPIEKAYGLQIAKTSEAFADWGIKVELIAPIRRDPIKQNFFGFYSVKKNFRIKKFFSPDFYFPGKLDKVSVAIKNFISALVLALYSVFKKTDFIYSRDELPLYFLSFFKKNLIFEVHRFSEKRTLFYKRFKKLKLKTVAISNGLKNEFVKFGFGPDNILVAPDGVDLGEFDIDISKEEARKKLNLPLADKIAIYSGHLFKWKGADTLAEASKFLKEVLFVFVGGMPADVKEFKLSIKNNVLSNVLVLGHKQHREIPCYLKAADVLVLPNISTEEISKYYTSPLKLFEYMASKRPIVASDLPSIREVLNGENAILVEPNKPKELARGIKTALKEEELAGKILSKAFEDVQNYTWRKRADKILNFIARQPKG